MCDEDGTSPLYVACENGRESTVQLLLNNGAEITLCRIAGASPLYIATINGYCKIENMLLEKSVLPSNNLYGS